MTPVAGEEDRNKKGDIVQIAAGTVFGLTRFSLVIIIF